MKKQLIIFLSILAATTIAHATVNDALSNAYEAAENYVKQGFSVREDAWGGDLGVKDQKAVTAQLFKGNQYWFLIATDITRGAVVTVSIYDSTGKLVQSDSWQKGKAAGATITPERSGTYYAIVTVLKSPAERTTWAMVYAYK